MSPARVLNTLALLLFLSILIGLALNQRGAGAAFKGTIVIQRGDSYEIKAGPGCRLNRHVNNDRDWDVGCGPFQEGPVSSPVPSPTATQTAPTATPATLPTQTATSTPPAPSPSPTAPSNLTPTPVPPTATPTPPSGNVIVLDAGTHARFSANVVASATTYECALGPAGERLTILDGQNQTAHAFQGPGDNVTIKNCIVQNYRTSDKVSAIIAYEGSGWKLLNLEVRNNSNNGVDIGAGGLVDGGYYHHNGQVGITGGGPNITVQNAEIAFNNAALQSNFRDEAGGTKFTGDETKNLKFINLHSHHNGGPGLWCDIDCDGVLYEGNNIHDNASHCIFHETSHFGVIRGNRCERNAVGETVNHHGSNRAGWWYAAEILLSASNDTLVENNVIVADGRIFGGIGVIEQGRNAEGDCSIPCLGRDNVIRNNQVHCPWVCAGTSTDNGAWNVVNDNVFEGNHYTNAGGAKFDWNDALRTFSAWQSFGHDDTGSATP